MTAFSLLLIMAARVSLVLAVEEQKNITAEPGQTVVLPCRAPDDKPVIAVQWKRTDLGSANVLLCTDGHCHEDHQHPSSQNRADLEDGEMKNGNASLILRNVTSNDTGTYECYVFQKETNSTGRASRTICTIHLNVSSSGRTQDGGDNDGGDKDGGDKDGGEKDGDNHNRHVGLGVGLTVVVLIVVIVVGVVGIVLYKKKKNSDQQHPQQIGLDDSDV